jgi:hypothetical protein
VLPTATIEEKKELSGPARNSRTMLVPASEPSLFHSSWPRPLTPSSATKKSVLPAATMDWM